MMMTTIDEDLPTLIARQDHLNVLRYIRAHKLREPQTVVRHGKLLLGVAEVNKNVTISKLQHRLGDAERLAALEQLCMASLDVGNLTLAEACLDAIQAGGGQSAVISKESSRYRKLLGMCLEASGDYDGASAVYDALLKDNPSNGHAAKRKYCILAAQPGKETEAAKALNDAAWNKMAEVCLSMSDYQCFVH